MSTDPREGKPSASNAEADALCPGRHNAQRGLPSPSSPYAEVGSLIHRALEGDATAEAKLNDFQRDIFEAARVIEQKVLAEWAQTPVLKRWRELRLWSRENDSKMTKRNSGQADVVWVDDDNARALIGDYKSLWGEITVAPKNRQLRDLAALVFENYPHVKEVSVFINQPLVSHSPVVVKYEHEHLKLAHAEMWARVDASMKEDAPRKAGSLQCKFCTAVLKCKVAQNFAFTLKEVNPLDLTPAELAELIEKSKVNKYIYDRIQAYAKALLAVYPNGIPGWMLEPGSERTQFTDAKAVHETLENASLISEDAFYGCITLSNPNLQDAIYDHAKVVKVKMTKKEAKERLAEVLKPWIVKKQDEPSLARAE